MFATQDLLTYSYFFGFWRNLSTKNKLQNLKVEMSGTIKNKVDKYKETSVALIRGVTNDFCTVLVQNALHRWKLSTDF